MGILEYRFGRLAEGCSPARFEEEAKGLRLQGAESKLTRKEGADSEKLRRGGAGSAGLLPAGLQAVRCFRECNEEAEPSGLYVVVAEAYGLETFRACDNTGIFFDPKTVVVEYLEPRRQEEWFDFSAEKDAQDQDSGHSGTRYLEYEFWELAPDTDIGAYNETINTWFRYVREHKKRLFDEWVSARYYRKVDGEGRPSGGYAMIFEYASHKEFQAYKKRRRHSYDTDTGNYLVYRDNDPYQFFDISTVGLHGLWPIGAKGWR